MAAEGTCANKYPVLKNFKLHNYIGCWHGYMELADPDNLKCKTVRFYYLRSNIFSSLFRGISTRDDKITTVGGSATMTEPDSGSFEGASGVYNVIATDYENFAIGYGCMSTGENQKNESIWIMTRARKPSKDVDEKINKALLDHNIDTTGIRKINQDDCKALGNFRCHIQN